MRRRGRRRARPHFRVLDLSHGTLGRFAGNYSINGPTDGVLATTASLNNPYWLALAPGSPPTVYLQDSGPNRIRKIDGLYLSVPAGDYIARIDGATSRLDQIAGTGSSGSSGNFGAATAATFNIPLQLAFRPGTRDLYLAEGSTWGIGMVAGANPTAITSTSLSAAATPVAVYPDQAQSIGAVLKDGSGAALVGRAVEFALDPGQLPGGFISAPQAPTDGFGIATVNARPGLALGSYGVIASASDLHGTPFSGSPVPLPISAVAPPAGLVFSAVNQTHVTAQTGVPGPGARAQVYQPHTLTVASSGTVYFADTNQLYKMQPSGLVSVLVPSSLGYQPWGLALDEANGVLYFADNSGYVRSLNLANGGLTVVAGGGTSNADGPAIQTTLQNPTRVRLIGGKLYVSDRTNTTSTGSRLRRIDLAAVPQTIETFLPELSSMALPAAPALQPTCTNTGPLVFDFCYSDPGCSVTAAPSSGQLYISGYFCGAASGQQIPAIVRVELDGSLTLIDRTYVVTMASLATDSAGNLYMAQNGGPHNFGYYVAVSGVVNPSPTFVPLATGAVVAEYVDQSGTGFSLPMDVFAGTHLWVADFSLNAVRVIW